MPNDTVPKTIPKILIRFVDSPMITIGLEILLTKMVRAITKNQWTSKLLLLGTTEKIMVMNSLNAVRSELGNTIQR